MPSQVRNHYSQMNQAGHLEWALAMKKPANLHCPSNVWPLTIWIHASYYGRLISQCHRWITINRAIRRSVMMKVRTMEYTPYHLTWKRTIWIINWRSFVQATNTEPSCQEQKGFHCRRNGVEPTLSLHALCFQIPKIHLRQWHHHHSSTAKSRPSSTNYWSQTMHHAPGHWCYPISLKEIRMFRNPWPVVITMCPIPNSNFWGSEKIHGGNRIHKQSLTKILWWQVLASWSRLETSDWSPWLWVGISRCSCRYTICVSIAWWFIFQNRSITTRCCKFWILLNTALSELRIVTAPKNIQSSNWRFVPFEDDWQIGHVNPLTIVSSWIWARSPIMGLLSWSSWLSMLASPRPSMIRNHGSPEWKCLIQYTIY